MAVFGTQVLATLVAVYGLFMPPIGWCWALLVWGYSLVWFLVNDRVKLLAYRILDPTKTETPVSAMPSLVKRADELHEPQGRRAAPTGLVQRFDARVAAWRKR